MAPPQTPLVPPSTRPATSKPRRYRRHGDPALPSRHPAPASIRCTTPAPPPSSGLKEKKVKKQSVQRRAEISEGTYRISWVEPCCRCGGQVASSPPGPRGIARDRGVSAHESTATMILDTKTDDRHCNLEGKKKLAFRNFLELPNFLKTYQFPRAHPSPI